MEYCISREPVFNRDFEVIAYQLFFSSNQSETNINLDPDVILTAINENDLNVICSGKKAFISCGSAKLFKTLARTFKAGEVMLAIHPEMEIDSEIVALTETLKMKGFELVLDEFEYQDSFKEIIPHCSIVCMDVQDLGSILIGVTLQKLHPFGYKCMLKNVDENLLFSSTLEFGFDYFEGSFFKKAKHLPVDQLPGSKIQAIQLLKEIHQPDINFDNLEKIIATDLSLSYKLMQLINSPAFGLRNEIQSIKQALVLLGAREVKSWLSWIIFRDMSSDKPPEILKLALQRAKFLELLAVQANIKNLKSQFYLLGLFSLIDVLLDQPLKEILDKIPIEQTLRDTLLGKQTDFSNLFHLARYYEESAINLVESISLRLNIPVTSIQEAYLDSIKISDEIFSK